MPVFNKGKERQPKLIVIKIPCSFKVVDVYTGFFNGNNIHTL